MVNKPKKKNVFKKMQIKKTKHFPSPSRLAKVVCFAFNVPKIVGVLAFTAGGSIK